MSIPIPESSQQAVQDLRDALHNLGLFVHQDGALLTDWALVCEWVDADGQYWLTAHSDSPPWRAQGMFDYALGLDLVAPIDGLPEQEDE